MMELKYEVPLYMLEYSEHELRKLFKKNGHSPLGGYEVKLDRANRAFQRSMGDLNVKWVPIDDPNTRLLSKVGHKEFRKEITSRSVRITLRL